MARRSNSLSTKELSMIKLKTTDEEAFQKFERDCLIRNLRAETLRYYKDKFAATKNTLKEMKIDKQLVELTQKDIEDIILHLKSKIKIVSINTRIRALKSFYNFLYKNKLVMPNPMKNIKQLRDRTRIIETLDDKELELLASHIKNQKSFIGVRDYVIFLVMLDTGIRLSELAGVQIDDIRGNNLIIRNTKNLIQRTVYLSKKVEDAVVVYLKIRGRQYHEYLFINIDNEPLKIRSIQSRFRIYKKELQINKQLSPHVFRHTFAKRNILAGMDAFSLAALLGHQDLTVTRRYVNLWGNDLEVKARQYCTINKLDL